MNVNNIDLTISFLEKKLDHPLFLPSGIINEIPDHYLAFNSGASCVVLKSITESPREGNPIPRVVKFNSGFINSVGLRNPGIKKAKNQINELIKKYKNKPIIISLFANSVDSFKRLIEEVNDLRPFAIELNLSCPNVSDEFGVMLSERKMIVKNVIREVKKEVKNIPLIAKLSPNSENIGELAKICESEGCDAISSINTLSSGMIIDIKKRRPILGTKKGGISGPAIKPLAIAKVYEIFESVKIPILGTGGIASWQDAVEMMMAGATLVGIGSAIYTFGYKIINEILLGMKKFIIEEKINKLDDIIGAAHFN